MNIVIGVTGGIAAYKIAELTSKLKKKNHQVQIIMTKNATEFITPLTLETLSNNKVMIDTFDRNFEYDVKHISIAKKADLFVIAPCTANMIAKIANGIADDLLSTTVLATKSKVLVCPAMNTNMYTNQITQDNINKLINYGFDVMETEKGLLACNDIGYGRLAAIDTIIEKIDYHLSNKVLNNKNIIISAGATVEKIDKVRYITNHSTGKMGYALAKQAYNMGANVTLVSANSKLKAPYGVNLVKVTSALEMYEYFKDNYQKYDYLIKAAAVSDYTINNPKDYKIKKDQEFKLELIKTNDILSYLGKNKKDHQVLVGFAMETENLIENATYKLINKNLDLIIANNLNDKGAGFGTDTNKVNIITKDEVKDIELMSKDELSKEILLIMKGIK